MSRESSHTCTHACSSVAKLFYKMAVASGLAKCSDSNTIDKFITTFVLVVEVSYSIVTHLAEDLHTVSNIHTVSHL